ncbi:extracellular solute-binding protein [Paenibacillus rhizovicinus]|uniref:Extracellular solute-binding protein n=1 Tax=Paenibacillus rhizovicinus TaxID=2704463 RepID=A0A6C0NZK1_9BACL|nr:extracellular solute-binding protein [Paenibacillus rhizovicinus]QHW31113.1 extracellular solute-binding protein [Paenibacillus rhizovicinus]
MNRSLKFKSLVLMASISLAALTACSNSNNGGDNAAGNGNTAAAGNDGTKATNGNAAASGGNAANNGANNAEDDDVTTMSKVSGMTIRIAANWDGTPTPDTPMGAKRLELQKAVEAKYNVKIQYLNIPNEEFQNKMKASILNGSPAAEIWYMGSSDVVPGLAKEGLFLPIDDLISLSDEKQIPVDDFRKYTGYNGKIYGFNTEASVDQIGIFYNRALFEKNGLPDPHTWVESKEWTWDKFREVAKQLTKDTNGDGKPDQWGLTGYAGDWVWFQALANGGHLFDLETGKQTLDDPKTQEAMDFMAKLFTEDKVVADSTWGFLDSFPKGNIGMTPSFSWTGGTWKANMKQDGYGFLPMPLGPGQTDYVNPSRQTNSNFIAKGTKYPEAVMQIWKELQVWDTEAHADEYYNAQYDHDDDIEVAKMLSKNVNFDFFNTINGGLIDQIGNELATGATTAAQAAQKYGPMLQDKADILLKQ